MNPCRATRLLTVLAMPGHSAHQAATRITWRDRLWAHTNRLEMGNRYYKQQPFLKSHRERDMEGTLAVTPD
jgi:hypothetical protein